MSCQTMTIRTLLQRTLQTVPSIVFSVLLFTTPIVGSNPDASDAKILIDTIESLQRPVEDFRCEFEGAMHVKITGDGWPRDKLGEGGLFESFSGSFIWKRGGDMHSETLHRQAFNDLIKLESVVVRSKENQAEEFDRANDAGIVYPRKDTPAKVRSVVIRDLGRIFLFDAIKRDAADESKELSVTDDVLDGARFKVLNVAQTISNQGKLSVRVAHRYWIDVNRGGHVVRLESYWPRGDVTSRLDVELGEFKLGKSEVWMPRSGTSMDYAIIKDKKPVIIKEPSVIETIRVVNSTMQFNTHPGPEVFTMRYKPGPAISEGLRKLTHEFAQQKPAHANDEG